MTGSSPFLDDETFATLTGDWERSDAALLGRRSFEGFDEVRRSAPDSPVIGFLASVARYVVSRPTYEPAWEGTTRAAALWTMTNDEATDSPPRRHHVPRIRHFPSRSRFADRNAAFGAANGEILNPRRRLA